METKTSYYGASGALATAGSPFREKGKESALQSFALELVPGTQCQLNCEACYKSGDGKPKRGKAMPLQDATSYIGQAQEAGFQEIVLIGGEPTLHPDLLEIVEFTRYEEGLKPILCTNGIRLADKAVVERLGAAETTVVTHASTPTIREAVKRYSGGPKGYVSFLERAIENLRDTEGITLVLEMPLTDSLFPYALPFFIHCRENGVIPFIELSRSRDDGQATSQVTPEQVRVLFETFRAYDERNFPQLMDQNPCPPAYGNKCTMTMTGLHVKNLGNGDTGGVFSCCAQKIRHGDLKEQPLAEILKSPTLAVFMDQDRYIVGPCKDCDLYAMCKGGCRGEAYLRFGCPRASSPACDRISEEDRKDVTVMAPQSCDGCPLEDCGQCALKASKTPKP